MNLDFEFLMPRLTERAATVLFVKAVAFFIWLEKRNN